MTTTRLRRSGCRRSSGDGTRVVSWSIPPDVKRAVSRGVAGVEFRADRVHDLDCAQLEKVTVSVAAKVFVFFLLVKPKVDLSPAAYP